MILPGDSKQRNRIELRIWKPVQWELHVTDLWETETETWKKMQLNLEPKLVVEGTAQCVRVVESENQNAFCRCHHNMTAAHFHESSQAHSALVF